MNARRSGLVLTLALLAAACGGDDGGGGDSDGGGAASTDPPTTDAAATDTGASPSSSETSPPPEGSGATGDPDATFRYMTYYEPSRFDPHLAANAGDANALFLAYDRLVHLSPEAEPVPGLAEEWEYSDDGLTLTLHLRDGVVFHDGAPFDAEAVVANLERAQTIEGSVVADDLSGVTAIEAVDPMTVELTLDTPQASLLPILSDRHGAMVCPSAFDDPDLPMQPCGAGMYRLTEYRPGDRMIYERFEEYWEPSAVGAARFEYILIPDATTRLNALRTGQADAAGIEPGQIEEAETNGLQIDSRSTTVYQQMYMNRAREPFDDVNVRRALNFAIDRETIVEAIDFGHGEPNSQIFPEGYWAFNEEIGTDYYTYDPEHARELLAEAGYADGFTFEMLLPTPGTPPTLAAVLQEQFADIGVTMNVAQTPAQGVADLFFVQQANSAMLGVWTGRQDPSMTTGLRWTSTGFSNPGGHTTPEIEELHERALTTLDPEDRAEAMHDLVAAGTEAALDLVIYNPVSVQAGSPQVATMPTIIANGKVEFRGASVSSS